MEECLVINIDNEIKHKFENYLIDLEESENTIKQYLYSLKNFSNEIGNELNKINFRRYKELLLEKRKPKTVNVRIAGIIKFIKFYAEYDKDKRYENIIIKNIKMQNKTYLNNVLSSDEFREMYRCVEKKDKKYYCKETEETYAGAVLDKIGMPLKDLDGEYHAFQFHFTQV